MVDYERLPEKGTPLIFHGVYGTERREANNPSFFNPEEISVIEDYVVHLLTVSAANCQGMVYYHHLRYMY